MATIYAKYNSSSVAMNPLDPDTWVGGVVPGPDDIARFYYYQNTSMGQTFNGTGAYTSTYMYLGSSQYSHVDSNFNYNQEYIDFDETNSVMVGDRGVDMHAAINHNVRGIRVDGSVGILDAMGQILR